MGKCTVTIYWFGGKSIVTEVEGTPDKLADFYNKAINNKQDLSFTWRSNKMQTVLNLDNVIAFEIVEDK